MPNNRRPPEFPRTLRRLCRRSASRCRSCVRSSRACDRPRKGAVLKILHIPVQFIPIESARPVPEPVLSEPKPDRQAPAVPQPVKQIGIPKPESLLKEPPEEKSVPLPKQLLADVPAAIVETETTPKKVAFFQKLWDYLNQVAFEIPLKKSD